MTTPAVSIIMAAYNAERFLPKTLASIQAQTFTDFELIVIDDKSTDQTPAILAKYATRDHRIVVLTNEQNKGPSFSRNRGLGLARGNYIAIQDADDTMPHDRLAKQVAYLEAHPTVGILSGTYCNVDGDSTIIICHPLPLTNVTIQWMMHYYSAICHGVSMYRRDLLAKLDGNYYPEELYTAEDYDLWDRLLIHTEAANLPDTLLYRTMHSQQLSASQRTGMNDNAACISHRAITRLMGREDFITLEEVTRLRPWYYIDVPQNPTPADFALADKWLQIWTVFAAKHHPTGADRQIILYNLTRALWLMAWARQPGSTRLLGELLKLAPLQLGRTVFMYFARKLKKAIFPAKN